MRRFFLFLIIFSLNTLAKDKDPQVWRGFLEVKGRQLHIEIVILDNGGRPQGRFYVNGQGEAPLDKIEQNETTLRFANQKRGISFEGKLSDDGSVAKGTFRQRDKQAPLTLRTMPDRPFELIQSWMGNLRVQNMELPMRLRIVAFQSGEQGVLFDDVARGRTYEATWSQTQDSFQFEVPFLQLQFKGALGDTKDRVEGTWRQPGQDVPFVMEKESASSQKEPVPKKNRKEPQPIHAEIPEQALKRVSARVQDMVDQREIVGGELLIIHRGKPILRQAFGWKDREAELPMAVDNIYCVRSMTKPLVGTAIQMLVEEGKLAFDTPVSQILPAFRGPQKGKITIGHLLAHEGGFPFTTMGQPLSEYGNLADLAEEAANSALLFEPGTDFEYSDASSDILGTVVAAITGEPVEAFIQTRILNPLGMHDSYTLLPEHKRIRNRVPSAYSGGTGIWSKHWSAEDPPIFPIFLTSQSLYATTTDYARFLTMWMNGGTVEGQRLLRAESVSRALVPRRFLGNYASGFPGLDVYYGQQWLVYAETKDGKASQPVLFGHDGSDGTHAWVWPERELMVLFFTQSRGTLAGVALARALQKYLLDQDFEEQSPAKPSSGLAQFEGLYWDEDVAHAYYSVKHQGARLTLERPGRMQLVFKADTTPGRFVHEVRSDLWIEFLISQSNTVTAMRTSFGGRVELCPKHVSNANLPPVNDVVAKVKKAHRLDLLSENGVIRRRGVVNLATRGMKGRITHTFDQDRERVEIRFGNAREMVLKDRDRVWTFATGSGGQELEGTRLEAAQLDATVARFGDWTEHCSNIEILKRVRIQGGAYLLVRLTPEKAHGLTLFVDETSGRVVRADSLVQIPGVGLVGLVTRYDDFRDVGGMTLPFRVSSKFASRLLGEMVTDFNQAKLGIEAKPKTFAIPKGQGK